MHRTGWLTGVADEALTLAPKDPGCDGQRHENPLRAVLHEPAARLVRTVLPVHERDQAAVRHTFPLQAPITPPVERQPVVTGRDVGPLGDG